MAGLILAVRHVDTASMSRRGLFQDQTLNQWHLELQLEGLLRRRLIAIKDLAFP